MHRVIKVAASLLILGAIGVLAQESPQMPKPTAEHQRLRYFVGEWRSEGDMKPGPFGPGGKFTSTDHNEMLGDFFLVLRSEGTSPMGPMKELAVMGYDDKEKGYTYDGYNSMGEHEVSKGTFSGDTWTWTNDADVDGKVLKVRFTMKQVSPASYTYRFETSPDGSSWTTVMEGKATKVK